MIKVNRSLAASLGIDPTHLETPLGAEILAGNTMTEGAEPIALAYAGHQFGNFVPQLGDGRAILLGEILDKDGNRRDLQLKGAGRTRFSRGGDGRAAVGPVLREYLERGDGGARSTDDARPRSRDYGRNRQAGGSSSQAQFSRGSQPAISGWGLLSFRLSERPRSPCPANGLYYETALSQFRG